MSLSLRAVVTEPGAHTLAQPELSARLRERLAVLPGSNNAVDMARAVYLRSGIARRHFELSDEALADRGDWVRAANEACIRLGVRTLRGLAEQGVAPADCDALVVASSSFTGFPALSRHLQTALDFPSETVCWDLQGLGCAAPTQAISFAHALLRDAAHRRICLLFVDVMGSLAECRRHPVAPDPSQIVAHCLASDAAAALVIEREWSGAPALSFDDCALSTSLWSGSMDQNDLTACAANQPYLSVGREIRIRMLEETALSFAGVAKGASLLMHPGGVALMEQVQQVYPALEDSVRVSRAVLSDNGNIGAASLVWVLARSLRTGLPLQSSTTLLALGPGIVTSTLRLEGVRTDAASPRRAA